MNYDNPQSRNEAILQNILGADNVLEPPQSRTEAALTAILNGEEYTGEAKSRVEMLLKEISQQGGGNVDVEALAVDQNGTYTAPEGTAYSPVTVNVSGGGGQEVPEKDVNFIDYDGTVLYSYTAQEALALTALPTNPSHEGLTAQGWNYTLAEVKTEVNAVGGATVGQMYVTDDGKTRIYLDIPEDTPTNRLTFNMTIQSTVSGNLVIDWGDGTSITSGETYAANINHTYQSGGKYTITVAVTQGTAAIISLLFGDYYCAQAWIKKIHVGASITGFKVGALVSNLECLTIPSGATIEGASAFASCYSLKCIIIPSGTTSIGQTAFVECSSLKKISIPPTVMSIAKNCFYKSSAIERIDLPYSITSIKDYLFFNCFNLKRCNIPSSITTIKDSAFSYCYTMGAAVIPANVTTINGSAFFGSGIGEYHVKPIAPPTITPTSLAVGDGTKIYVPAASLETYKTATNWSSYASKMVGE